MVNEHNAFLRGESQKKNLFRIPHRSSFIMVHINITCVNQKIVLGLYEIWVF